MVRPPVIPSSQEVLDLFEAFSDGDLSSDLSAATAPCGAGTVPQRWRSAVKTLKGQDLVVRTQWPSGGRFGPLMLFDARC